MGLKQGFRTIVHLLGLAVFSYVSLNSDVSILIPHPRAKFKRAEDWESTDVEPVEVVRVAPIAAATHFRDASLGVDGSFPYVNMIIWWKQCVSICSSCQHLVAAFSNLNTYYVYRDVTDVLSMITPPAGYTTPSGGCHLRKLKLWHTHNTALVERRSPLLKQTLFKLSLN